MLLAFFSVRKQAATLIGKEQRGIARAQEAGVYRAGRQHKPNMKPTQTWTAVAAFCCILRKQETPCRLLETKAAFGWSVRVPAVARGLHLLQTSRPVRTWRALSASRYQVSAFETFNTFKERPWFLDMVNNFVIHQCLR
eukprot:6189767-Pleurochrysis_carterae.AAC.1